MISPAATFLFITIIFSGSAAWHTRHNNLTKLQNILITDVLSDGETETRIRFNGLTAKETAVVTRLPSGESDGLMLRQVTDGRNYIQAIFSGDGLHMKDCEILHQKKFIKNFLDSFKKDLEQISESDYHIIDNYYGNEGENYKNVTFRIINKKLPERIKKWLDYSRLKNQCKKVHKEIRELVQHKNNGNPEQEEAKDTLVRTKRFIFASLNGIKDIPLTFPGTNWCGNGNQAKHFGDIGYLSRTDRCCRIHDLCDHVIHAFEKKYGYFNLRLHSISSCYCDERKRRNIMESLRIPGTNWCGRGHDASGFSQLGHYTYTDKCCRNHDFYCPHYINSLEKKYGLFNWRLSTLMHCSCDESFRSCLKQNQDGMSNFVGKIFFNVVQSKCFILKKERVCKRYSWWAKCVKYGRRRRAILRNNVYY